MIERLGAKLIDVRFERDFFAHYVRDGLKTVMPILMYAFRDAFETYLAGLDADVPKTVEEWAKAYSTELRNSQFPPEESRPSHASLVLKEALNHSSADEDYRSMIEDTLPMLTRTKRELFQRFSIAAMIMPYQPNFAETIVMAREVKNDELIVTSHASIVAI